MNQRGSALMHVLLVTMVVGLICASIMRARLQPALAAANMVEHIQSSAADEAALNRVTQVWMSGGSCSSDATAGVSCSGSGCSCRCTVTGLGSVTAAVSGGACSLSVTFP